jgi:hypothetical protein
LLVAVHAGHEEVLIVVVPCTGAAAIDPVEASYAATTWARRAHPTVDVRVEVVAVVVADPTVRELAELAGGHFTTRKRGDEAIWVVEDDAPPWVTDLVLAAHDAGNLLPDDWRYGMIVDALQALAEVDDPDDADVRGDVDIVTHRLLEWAASHGDRLSYVDQGFEDFRPSTDIASALQLGQRLEREDVLAAVRAFLVDHLETLFVGTAVDIAGSKP